MIDDTIEAVVVLPFVAEIRAEPPGRRAARRSIAPGSTFHRILPGSVVPPPAPARRERRAAARAAAISTESGIRSCTASEGTFDPRFSTILRFQQDALAFLVWLGNRSRIERWSRSTPLRWLPFRPEFASATPTS